MQLFISFSCLFLQEGAASTAKVYADVNEVRPNEYSDYEALTVSWGDQARPPFLFVVFMNM